MWVGKGSVFGVGRTRPRVHQGLFGQFPGEVRRVLLCANFGFSLYGPYLRPGTGGLFVEG